MKAARSAALSSMLALAMVTPAVAQHEHGAAAADKVGSTSVNFQTSCAPASAGRFQPRRGSAALLLVR